MQIDAVSCLGTCTPFAALPLLHCRLCIHLVRASDALALAPSYSLQAAPSEHMVQPGQGVTWASLTAFPPFFPHSLLPLLTLHFIMLSAP